MHAWYTHLAPSSSLPISLHGDGHMIYYTALGVANIDMLATHMADQTTSHSSGECHADITQLRPEPGCLPQISFHMGIIPGVKKKGRLYLYNTAHHGDLIHSIA